MNKNQRLIAELVLLAIKTFGYGSFGILLLLEIWKAWHA